MQLFPASLCDRGVFIIITTTTSFGQLFRIRGNKPVVSSGT
jgi:hypothetical protein